MPKVQEASRILRMGFGLSKRPNFNSIYLVRVLFLTGIAVQGMILESHTYYT